MKLQLWSMGCGDLQGQKSRNTGPCLILPRTSKSWPEWHFISDRFPPREFNSTGLCSTSVGDCHCKHIHDTPVYSCKSMIFHGYTLSATKWRLRLVFELCLPIARLSALSWFLIHKQILQHDGSVPFWFSHACVFDWVKLIGADWNWLKRIEAGWNWLKLLELNQDWTWLKVHGNPVQFSLEEGKRPPPPRQDSASGLY